MLSINSRLRYFSFALLLNMTCSYASFTDMDCLKANYATTVEHKAFPFGLTKNILNIKKDKCVITLQHNKLKYINNKWIIDICRTPIHIKSDTGSIEVVKRLSSCLIGDKEGYCGLLQKIENLIQDDGLIFAEGGKENIDTDHGKVYCTSLLVDAHLRSGLVFDWTSDYSKVLKRKSFKEKPKKTIGISNNSETGPELIPADF